MQQTAFISIDKNCPVGTAKVKAFPSTHMPSPWNTAQYMESQHMQGQSQQHCSTQKPTTWGTSTLPPVDIEVLSTPEPVTQQNTKFAWTSAEQLADAIFPNNTGHIANSIEPFHHALLNHKTEIENLHHGALKYQTDIGNLHHGALNHKTEIENLHQGVLNQKADMKNLHVGVRNQKTDINNLHLGVLNHKDEIEKLCVSTSDMIKKQMQQMSTQQLLYSAHDAKFGALKKTVTATQESASALDSLTKNHSSLLKTHAETLNSVNKQQKEQYEGLINHRNTLRDVVSAKDKMKTKSSKQEQSLLSMQRDITEIKNNLRDETTANRLVDLNACTRDLEQKVSSLVSSNNVINSHISNLQAQASTDRPVQMVMAPRRH